MKEKRIRRGVRKEDEGRFIRKNVVDKIEIGQELRGNRY